MGKGRIMERKQQPLWLWGLVLILAAGASFAILGPVQGTGPQRWGEAFGRGIVQAGALLAGVVLIILHFARSQDRDDTH